MELSASINPGLMLLESSPKQTSLPGGRCCNRWAEAAGIEPKPQEDGRARLRLLESSQKDAGCYVHRRAEASYSSTKEASRMERG
jgi:hypothetical protein